MRFRFLKHDNKFTSFFTVFTYLKFKPVAVVVVVVDVVVELVAVVVGLLEYHLSTGC